MPEQPRRPPRPCATPAVARAAQTAVRRPGGDHANGAPRPSVCPSGHTPRWGAPPASPHTPDGAWAPSACRGTRVRGAGRAAPGRGHAPMGKLLKALLGEGPLCSSAALWGVAASRKGLAAGGGHGGGFPSRLGSSWRDWCICCCAPRGRPWGRQHGWGDGGVSLAPRHPSRAPGSRPPARRSAAHLLVWLLPAPGRHAPLSLHPLLLRQQPLGTRNGAQRQPPRPARPQQCAAGPAEARPPALPRDQVICPGSTPALRGRCPASPALQAGAGPC